MSGFWISVFVKIVNVKVIPVSIVIPAVPNKKSFINLVNILARQSSLCKKLPGEIIIVFDGGRGIINLGRYKLPFRERIKVVSTGEKARGPACARNRGVEVATFNWILLLDDDVVPAPDFIDALDEVLSSCEQSQLKDFTIGEGRVELFDKWRFGPFTVGPENTDGGAFLTACVLIEKKSFENSGRFDETFRLPAYEDVDLAYRMNSEEKGRFLHSLRVLHEPRELNFARLIFEARSWRYVLYMAYKHGFVGWPRYPSKRPFIDVLIFAALKMPLGRVMSILTFPRVGIKGLFKGFWLCVASSAMNTFFVIKSYLDLVFRGKFKR